MFRSAAFLALVLSHVAPTFSPRTEASRLLSSLGTRYDIDPLLVVADVEHESRWQESVINPSSGTAGLMQIQPEGRGCRGWDPNVDACGEVRGSLLHWRENLRVGFVDFAAARRYCVAHEYGGLAVQWLQMITGHDAVRHSHCGYRNGKRLAVPKSVRALMARRAELARLR